MKQLHVYALAVIPVFALASLVACKSEEEKPPGATAGDELGRPLSDMELPVSLRNGDPAPVNPFAIEATTEQLRLDGVAIAPLEKGRFLEKDADRTTGIVPKLAEKLRGATRSTISFRLQANVPYETTALVMNTAKQAGIQNAAFQVRKTGTDPKTGWLAINNYVMSSRADDLPPITAVPAQSWDIFTAKWQDVHDGCRSAKTGNCAYVDDNYALGGTLKIELFASGRGVNIDFYRRGLTPAQEEDEKKKRSAFLATKKEDFLQGRIDHDEMVKILLLGDPSTQALFQFRYQEALQGPSALTATMAPMCHGSTRCGVVIAADNVTTMVNLMTLIGATFPDGTTAPAWAIEAPWTKRPKIATPQWATEKDPALEMALELGLTEK